MVRTSQGLNCKASKESSVCAKLRLWYSPLGETSGDCAQFNAKHICDWRPLHQIKNSAEYRSLLPFWHEGKLLIAGKQQAHGKEQLRSAEAEEHGRVSKVEQAADSRGADASAEPSSQGRQGARQSSRQKAGGAWSQPSQVMLPRHGIFYSATFTKSPGLPKSSMSPTSPSLP